MKINWIEGKEELRQQVWNQLFWDQIGGQIWGQAGRQVADQVWWQVRDQLNED